MKGSSNLCTCAVLLLFEYLLFSLRSAKGEFEVDLTLQNVWDRFSVTDEKCMIQCISSDETPNKIKFSRHVDTGQGTRLPRYSQQYILGRPLFARILSMRKEDKLSRFGAYQCKVTKNAITTEVVTLKLPPLSLAELDISPHYQVVNVGDDVVLKAKVLKAQNLPIRWRHNGKRALSSWDNLLNVTLNNVQTSDSGVYECYYEGRRNESLHALTRLVVRGCAAGFYGDTCDQECPPCYNGGVCHETWGVCVCPPGFKGPNCEKACGGNHFGSSCSKLCSPPNNYTDVDNGCALYLFCKPDPYSCSCAPGFKGPKCVEHCEPGWYGADCKQPCHCAFGASACHRITGACNRGCAEGWRGESCQISDPSASAVVETTTSSYCPVGHYGARCEHKCHCADNEPCDITTGQCPSGCKDGWDKLSCSACKPGRFGSNCEFVCHCAGGDHTCDKDGFCLRGCKAGWTGFTCQQECAAGRFGQNCASSCHCLAGPDACDRITGLCDGECEAGYMGRDCQVLCPRNTYGINCRHNCSCLNNGNCNRIDGSCTCEARWRGHYCNESEPQIVAATDEEVNTGQFVFISCTADAIPEPEINITCRNFSQSSFHIRSLEKNQYQAVMKVTPLQEGSYKFLCSAKNMHGVDVKTISLTVLDPPELRDPPELVNATEDSLTFMWRAWNYSEDTGGKRGDYIEYMVMYREKGAMQWKPFGGWNTGTSATVHPLESYTLYEVSVKCRRPGAGGEGSTGPGTVARTECGAPPPDAIPENFLPDMMSADSVHLVWRGPTEKALKCGLTGYALIYYNDQKPEDKVNLTMNVRNEVEVVGLFPDTLYTFRLYPASLMGLSKYFAELNFRTAASVPGPVQDMSCEAVEDTLLLRWSDPVPLYGTVVEYSVTYELKDKGQCGKVTEDEESVMQYETTSKNEVTLKNLAAYSTYLVTVTAKTAAGEGEPATLSAVTAEAAPDAGPSNVRAESVTEVSIELIWDPIPCEYANGLITEYEYTLVISDLWESEDLPIFEKAKRSADVAIGSLLKRVKGSRTVVENLKPYTKYGFAVRGYTKAEPGPFSEFIFVRTKEAVPSAPRRLSIDFVGANHVTLSWSKPHPTNGELLKYRIQYQVVKDSKNIQHVILDAGDENIHQRIHGNVTELEGSQRYSFKVQAYTSAGWGNWSEELLCKTSEGIPEMPADLALLGSEETKLNISWKPPEVKNGIITGYKVAYVPVTSLDTEYEPSTSERVELTVDADTTDIALLDLHVSTQYLVEVQAATVVGYGPQASIHCWTLVANQEPPSVHALATGTTNETIAITFSTDEKFSVQKYQVIVEDARNSEPIDENLLDSYEKAVVEQGLPYYIAAELDPNNISDDGQQGFVVGDRKIWGGYKNVHLNPGHKYKIRVRMLTKQNNELKSLMSEAEEQTAAAGPDSPVDYQHKKKILGLHLFPFILIALSVFIIAFLIFFFTSFAVCREREKKRTGGAAFSNRASTISDSVTWSIMYKVSENESADGPLVSDGWKYSSNIDKSSLKRSKAYAKNCQGIAIENLPEYVNNAIANSKLSEEFKQLVSGQTAAWSIARKSENLKKNRYGNILPYDRSCVILLPEPNVSDSEYINASYVDGYNRPREYIVTQGPLESTVVDFWRMIWQENAPAIVMLTDLVENGKKKCFKYWPDDSMISGNIQVLLIHVEENADFIIRTILMQKKDENRTHRVLQYQFTGWPDRTVPSTPYFLLKMIRKLRQDHPVLGGPIVVHCSAGAGRSGTYIAVDALMEQANNEKRVDIFPFVNRSRLQRINLVQTEEQYVFIHEALVEAVRFEETSVPLEKIHFYLKELKDSSLQSATSLIGKQFQALKDTQRKQSVSTSCSVALSEHNVFKNRDVLTVPTDSSRILLYSECDVDKRGDYINAVVVDGYRQKCAYIVTHMPMHHTVQDFLQLVYQSKSSLILMLNSFDEEDDVNNGQYWPSENESTYGNFEVEIVALQEHEDYVVRAMKLTKHGEELEKPHIVMQLQYKEWDYEEQFLSNTSLMINLINSVDHWHKKAGTGPVVVHCMDGATRCGLFCASCYVYAQAKAEGVIDAYEAVKCIRANRPEFIPNLEQFAFCFKLASEHESFVTVKEETSSSGTLKRLPYRI